MTDESRGVRLNRKKRNCYKLIKHTSLFKFCCFCYLKLSIEYKVQAHKRINVFSLSEVLRC